MLGAGRQVDVVADPPGLRDQLQARQLLDQLAADRRAVTDQHQDVGVAQPHRELSHSLDGVGEHLDGIGLQFAGALQLADGVLVVVQNHDVHGRYCAGRSALHAGPSCRVALISLA